MSDELTFTDLDGHRQTWREVEYGQPSPVTGTAVQVRMVRAAGGRRATQKLVPDAAASEPGGCDPLENEARAAYRLADRFLSGHPAELARMLGHDLDAVQPFLLTELPRGVSLVELAGQLGVDEQHDFEVSLFRALHCLAGVGLVHGEVCPATVWWDGNTRRVQLRDFGHTSTTGDRVIRRRDPQIPGWRRPATAARATPADDVLAAGLLLLYAITGQSDPEDLESRGPALRSLLDGVFAGSPPDRPDALTMLRRLSATPIEPAPPSDADLRFEEGLLDFDRVLAAKFRPEPAVTSDSEVPRMTRGRSTLLLAGVVVLFATVAVLFLVLGVAS